MGMAVRSWGAAADPDGPSGSRHCPQCALDVVTSSVILLRTGPLNGTYQMAPTADRPGWPTLSRLKGGPRSDPGLLLTATDA